MKKKYLGLMALVLPLWAVAQEPVVKTQQEPYEWNAANGEKLQALKAKGDPVVGAITFQICESCHRADASGRVSGAYPRLAGQHPSVLIKQMTDIRAGRRDNPKMEPFITDHVVTPQEIADIASYVSTMPIPSGNGKGPGLELARGKKLYAADCATCHGEKGEGSDAKFYPMVAAQHFKYLLREGKYIKDGTRRNANPKMKKIIAQYTDEDIEAVSDYMSQLPPPR